MQFTPDQLATGGDLTPNLIVSLGADVPQDISFDHAGNLWTVANPRDDIAGSQLQMYTAAELSGSGTITPTPAVTITGARIPRENESKSLFCSDGMAFDAAGNLWVANTCTDSKFGLGSIVEFTSDQLTTSGAPIPSLFWNPNKPNKNLYEPSLLTFGPPLR
jgi:secreted PhoX family phosphatase